MSHGVSGSRLMTISLVIKPSRFINGGDTSRFAMNDEAWATLYNALYARVRHLDRWIHRVLSALGRMRDGVDTTLRVRKPRSTRTGRR